jgi:cholesterol transport system auxiliary component
MSTQYTFTFLFIAFAVWLAPGCALLQKGEQGDARFFSIEQAPFRLPAVSPNLPAASPESVKIRLGTVTGALHLEERLVFRDKRDEVGYYRERRWTEPPEVFLKQMISRALFEERGISHVVGGSGPTLDIQLTALDEIRIEPHRARAEVIATLHDEHVVLFEKTVTVERPIIEKAGGDSAAATVDALGKAMQAAVDQIADRVLIALNEQKAVAPSLKQEASQYDRTH